LPKLFTSALNLYRTSLIQGNGIGIGLMVVKQIVESANGKVVGESEGPNRGS